MSDQAVESTDAVSRATQPLPAAWKILTFLFPVFFGFVFSRSLIAKGYFRKGLELKTWTYSGLTFYVVLIAVAQLLAP